MKFLLFILSVITLFMGADVITSSKTVLHEVVALLFFVISAIFFSSACIVETFKKTDKVEKI